MAVTETEEKSGKTETKEIQETKKTVHIKNGRRKAAGLLFAVCGFVLCVFLFQRILMPKYRGSVIEGCFTEEYYREEHPHDLLIIGNCESYENISPMKLWVEYGITSYIRGNSNQLMQQSYYLLKEALRYETPKAVLLNVQAMMVDGQDTESYNRMVFDGMRWSLDKLRALQETMMEEEHLFEYLFPILRYHDRWKELTKEDFTYAFRKPEKRSYKGYYLRADIRPYTEFPKERRKPDYTFPKANYEALDAITVLCKEKEIPLILMKAPSFYPEWVPPYEEQITAYAKEQGLPYYNTLSLSEEIGLDFTTDTYDEGLHLNVYGAEKVAVWLGEILVNDYGFPDHRSDAELAAEYNAELARYEAEKKAQAEEFAALGYIKKYRNE